MHFQQNHTFPLTSQSRNRFTEKNKYILQNNGALFFTNIPTLFICLPYSIYMKPKWRKRPHTLDMLLVLTTSIEIILETAIQWNISHHIWLVKISIFVFLFFNSFTEPQFILAKRDTIISSTRYIDTIILIHSWYFY